MLQNLPVLHKLKYIQVIHTNIDPSSLRESVHTRLDLSQTRLDLSQTRLDRSQTRLDRSQTRLDRSHTRLDRSHTRLDRSYTRLDRSDSFRSISVRIRAFTFRSLLTWISSQVGTAC